jgi:hypothetical protein
VSGSLRRVVVLLKLLLLVTAGPAHTISHAHLCALWFYLCLALCARAL